MSAKLHSISVQQRLTSNREKPEKEKNTILWLQKAYKKQFSLLEVELQLEKDLIRNKMVHIREMLHEEIHHLKSVEEAQLSLINKLQLQREENLRIRYEDLENNNQTTNKKLYEQIDEDVSAILRADTFNTNDNICRLM